MTVAWKHIEVDWHGEICRVRLRQYRIDEPDIPTLTSELISLGSTPGCKYVALSLGPRPPELLYSVFLGKLMTVQRRLAERDCSLILCDASPEVQAIFKVCHFAEHFHFAANFEAALAAIAPKLTPPAV